MDPPTEIDVPPLEIPSTVAGIDNPDNAGWIEIKFKSYMTHIIHYENCDF